MSKVLEGFFCGFSSRAISSYLSLADLAEGIKNKIVSKRKIGPISQADSDRERLKELIEKKGKMVGQFCLSSGAESRYYFDLRSVTLDPEGLYLAAKEIFGRITGQVEAVGGLTLGADPLAAAVAVISHLAGDSIPAFIVRSETKEHGTQKRIEGQIPEKARVAVVDDVLTSGGSVLRAADALEAEGHKVGMIVVLLDRQQGGKEKITERGYDFHALFKADSEGNIINE